VNRAPQFNANKGFVSLKNDILLLDFPYNKGQVEEIKMIAGARWDKLERVWRVPLTSVEAVRKFSEKHGFALDSEVQMFLVPSTGRTITAPSGVSVTENNILIYFPFDPVKVKMAKKISGVTWDAKTMAWKAPLASVSEAIRWAENFDMPVSSEVRDIAAAEADRAQLMLDASRTVDADVQIEGLVGSPFPYQKAGMAYCISVLTQSKFKKGVIIGDQPGLGKTVQSLGVLESLNAFPAIIVCPATLKLNWEKEINRWLPHRTTQVLTGKTTHELNADIVIINYDILVPWTEHFRGFKAIVADESHYVKSKTAQRTKAALKISKRLLDKEAVRICLTGTPVTNRPAELATQLDLINQINDFGGYIGFYRTYCAAYRDKWGHWCIDGASNLDVLHEKLRANCYVRRTKEQVLPELPTVIHSPVRVQMTPAGAKEYAKAEADIVNYLVERAKEIALELGVSVKSAAVRARMAAEANQHLVRISVLRRLAAKAKLPAVIEWVESRVEAGSKVAIAAHHRDVVDELASHFGGLKIQGQMSVAEVEEAKRKFQELPCAEAPVIVLSMQAAKTGHTLTAAQDILFVELPWTPADVDQTYGRLHRIGQKGSVTATYMLAENSIDQKILDLINTKRSVVDALTDGIEGVAEQSMAQALVEMLTAKA
jgi:SNF2 family DNA or RNA helicase